MHTGEHQKRMVVVLGMHRSGTSLVTRALHVLGVSLGDHLMPPVEHNNEKGFWEDLDVNALNIGLLKTLGRDWHAFTPLLPNEFSGPAVVAFQESALQILRQRLCTTDCFGLKDPRMCRLLPFWQDVFVKLQVRVSYVVVCRNPLSVAHSLAKRDGFDLQKACYLWLDHMLESLVWTQNRNRIVVEYDRFLAEPARQLERMAQALSLSFDATGPEATGFLTDFLEPSMRHNQHRPEDLELQKTLPANLTALYKLLAQLGSNPSAYEGPQIASAIASIRAQHQDDYPALYYLEEWEQRHARLVGERDKRIAELCAALTARQATIGSLQNEVSRMDSQLRMICSSRAWKMARVLRKLALPFKRLVDWPSLKSLRL
jgi:hypothetical protein